MGCNMECCSPAFLFKAQYDYLFCTENLDSWKPGNDTITLDTIFKQLLQPHDALTNEYRTVSHTCWFFLLTVGTQCYIQRGGTEGARPHGKYKMLKWFMFSNISNAVWLTPPFKAAASRPKRCFTLSKLIVSPRWTRELSENRSHCLSITSQSLSLFLSLAKMAKVKSCDTQHAFNCSLCTIVITTAGGNCSSTVSHKRTGRINFITFNLFIKLLNDDPSNIFK